MPWKATCPMQLRQSFIEDWLRQATPISQLCQVYGISRKTGYKWIERFKEEGFGGMQDRPRTRHTQAFATDELMENELLSFRLKHPTWGPKKIKAALERSMEGLTLPAASTIGAILKRNGLVQSRRRVRKLKGSSSTAPHPSRCHELWNADFKGQFRLGSGKYCYPLTVTDAHSRYLLCCESLTGTGFEGVHTAFEKLFKDQGMPLAIRTDNGIPFASVGAGRLSLLSVWWLRLGIQLIRIAPGKPQENGSHERMHRTLKAETTRPPASSLAGQQRKMDAFRREFNDDRPHEALGQIPPSDLYHRSVREYPAELPEPEYPGHWERRRVRKRGLMKFCGHEFFLSASLSDQLVGLCETDDGIWRVEFCGHAVAEIDLRKVRLIPLGGGSKNARQGTRYNK